MNHAGAVLGVHDGVSVAKMWPSSAVTRRAPRPTGEKRSARLVEDTLGGAYRVHDVRPSFRREPDFGVVSVNYNLAELLVRPEAAALACWAE